MHASVAPRSKQVRAYVLTPWVLTSRPTVKVCIAIMHLVLLDKYIGCVQCRCSMMWTRCSRSRVFGILRQTSGRTTLSAS